MVLPKFLLADNSELDDAFVLHTQFPRFLINIQTDDVEWFDEIEDEEDLDNQIRVLVEEAYKFFEDEMQAYEEEDEEEYGV